MPARAAAWPRRLALAAAFGTVAAAAEEAAPAPLGIGFVSLRAPQRLPNTFLDPPPEDEGVQGARLGLADNETTGRFTGQRFALEERTARTPEEALDAARALLAACLRFLVADLPAPVLLQALGGGALRGHRPSR